MSLQERHRLAVDAGEVADGGKALPREALGMRPPGRRADLHRQVMVGRDLHVAAIDGGQRRAPFAVEQRQERREVRQWAVEFVDQASLDAAIGQHDGRRLQAIGEAGHNSSGRLDGWPLARGGPAAPLPRACFQCERSSRCLLFRPVRPPCAVRCSPIPAIRSATGSNRRWSTNPTPSWWWPTARSRISARPIESNPTFRPTSRSATMARTR